MPHQLILHHFDEFSLFAWSTKPRAAFIPEVPPIRIADQPDDADILERLPWLKTSGTSGKPFLAFHAIHKLGFPR